MYSELSAKVKGHMDNEPSVDLQERIQCNISEIRNLAITVDD